MQIRTPDGGYETRAANAMQPYGSTVPPPPGGDSFGGGALTARGAMQQVAVYGSVSIIAEAIATLPIKQYRLVGGTGGECREMDPAPVIVQPYSEITQRDFIIQGSMSMLLQGTVWGDIITRDENLMPEQVKLCHPDHARVRRNQKGQVETRYWGQLVPPDNVTRQFALSAPEDIKGLSPIEYLRLCIGRARQQDIYASAFLANSARPDGWIGVEDDLDADEVEKMALAWKGAHQGVAKAGLPGVLTGGAEWHPITMSMADAQFLQQMQWSASEISGMIYRVPPHMLGMTDKETSWGCLPGDAQVFTTSGPKAIVDVREGDEVWSLGTDGMVRAKVKAQVRTGVRRVLSIETIGRTLRATANHRVPIRRYFGTAEGRRWGETGWENIWVRADEIRAGDFLMVPHGFDVGGVEIAPNGRRLTVGAMELCGLYTGDGSLDKNRVEIAHEAKPDHMDHYKQVVRDEFGVEPYTDRRRTRFSSSDAVELLNLGFTGTALTKRVPDWVFALTPRLRLAFLRGYLDSDGSVQRGRIIYSSAHPELLEDVRHLCMGVGVPVGRVCHGRDGGPMTIDGRTYLSQPKYQLSLSSLPFNSRIGSNSPRKAARFVDDPHDRKGVYDDGWLGNANRRSQDRRQNPGWGWDLAGVTLQRVRRVTEDADDVPVYDIEVEGTASFVADGVIVHNSGIEQQELGFVRNTLLIWLCRWEDLMRAWLPRRQFVSFDLSQRLRGDTLQRWSAWQIGRVIGAINGAEVRAFEGLPKVTDPAAAALLEAYDTPFTSSPVKPTSGGAGGDKSN